MRRRLFCKDFLTKYKMEVVATDSAPAAIGPYSQALKANGFLFVSGQIPLTAEGVLIEGGIEEQADQVLKNLAAVLLAGGSGLGRVMKTTVFIKDMNDFPKVNEVYARFFGEHKPARATVEVSRLPKDVLIEIECVAIC